MPEQPVPVVRSSSRNLSDVQSSDGVKPVAGNEAAAEPDTRQVVRPSAMATGSLGAAPLPGGPWTDPDAANWSEIPAQPTDAARRRGWLGERGPGDVAAGQEDDREPRPAKSPLGGRILERLRPSPRVARLPDASGASDVQAVVPPDIGRWPRPVRLEQQFTHLGEIAAALGQAGESLTLWIDRSRVILGEALETRGPRDAAADSSLVALGEHVLAGMSLADTTADAGVASHTRRAALAIARRASREGTRAFTQPALGPRWIVTRQTLPPELIAALRSPIEAMGRPLISRTMSPGLRPACWAMPMSSTTWP
jgi:hypothetical protein